MNCPRCQAALREREREVSAGEIVVMDACPNCGGLWLDKGELEKLTRLEDRYYAGGSNDAPQGGRRNDRRDDDDDDDDDDRGGFGGFGSGQGGQQGGRRNGFLGGLFDSFGGND